MVAAAKLPNPTTPTRTRLTEAAPPAAPADATAATPAALSSSTPNAPAGDTYGTTRGGGTTNRAPTSDAGAPVAVDPELSRQARSGMLQAQVGGRPGTARSVAVTHSDAGDLNATNVSGAQTTFRGDMRTALGREVANPPSEADLRAYFRTMRGRPDDAVGAYERYSDAFGRHDGEHNYRSVDRQYVLDDGRVLSGRAEAERLRHQGHNYTSYENNAPNNFREATRDRGTDRRSAMDCEGYAVTAGALLGEAGLTSRHVVGNASDTDGHAVAVATDPTSGRRWVLSNGDAYPVGSNLRTTLDRAFGDTVMTGLPPNYYEGASQDEAAFRQMRRSPDGRVP